MAKITQIGGCIVAKRGKFGIFFIFASHKPSISRKKGAIF